MAKPHPEQLAHQHPQAASDCEGCYGSGWLTCMVDDRLRLLEAQVKGCRSAPFVLACDECAVYDDDEAILAARAAGMNVEPSGLYHEKVT